jgi:hypothetical protein
MKRQALDQREACQSFEARTSLHCQGANPSGPCFGKSLLECFESEIHAACGIQGVGLVGVSDRLSETGHLASQLPILGEKITGSKGKGGFFEVLSLGNWRACKQTYGDSEDEQAAEQGRVIGHFWPSRVPFGVFRDLIQRGVQDGSFQAIGEPFQHLFDLCL